MTFTCIDLSGDSLPFSLERLKEMVGTLTENGVIKMTAEQKSKYFSMLTDFMPSSLPETWEEHEARTKTPLTFRGIPIQTVCP